MKKVGVIILILILFISSILIGSPIKYNAIIINIGSLLVGIIFFLVNRIKYKNRIIENKLDISVCILCLIPLLPIIANTYVSLNDSVQYVLKYLTGLVIYFLTKQLCKVEKKYISYIVNTIIASAVMLCIFGIDNMTTNMFTKFLEKLDCVYVINIEHRMFSSLGYANSFAILIAMASVLITGKYVKTVSNKTKAGLIGILFLFLSCILLSYSKSTILLLAIAIIALLILFRDKKKRIEISGCWLLSISLACIYATIWSKMILSKQYLGIWIITGIFILIAMVLEQLIQKVIKKLEKIKLKTYLIMTITCILLVVTAIMVGMQAKKPIVIFQNNKAETEVKYKIGKIEPNTHYIFEFDIEAKSKLENKQNYTIRIEEENKYYDTVKVHEISFNSYTGKKQVEWKTTAETVEIGLYFKSDYKIAQARTNNKIFKNKWKRRTFKLFIFTSRISK